MDLLSRLAPRPARRLLPGLVASTRLDHAPRRRSGLRYSSLALVRDAMPRSSRIRRHLPFAPVRCRPRQPRRRAGSAGSIVSCRRTRRRSSSRWTSRGSMCATDIPPNRLLAAEAAAASFIERQASTTRIGIVAFAGFAAIVQTPDDRRGGPARRRREPDDGRRTAIGSAILESSTRSRRSTTASPRARPTIAARRRPRPVPKGAYAPAIIVLLTDGANNAGPHPVDAAQQAAARGVRVYTIGYGTENPDSQRPPCRLAVHRARAGGKPGRRRASGISAAAAVAAADSGARSTRRR